MDIQGIDHIELYVGDARQAAYVFRTAFGFQLAGRAGPETGLADQRSLLLRQGGVQLLLTSALADSHPAARYVAQHGDGVAVIAFRTDDAEHSYAVALARGAQAVSPPLTYTNEDTSVCTATVAGFGDVVHRLVSRRGSGAHFLPGVLAMTAEAEPTEAVLDAIDHVAVCLPAGEVDPTVARYQNVFGFRETFEEYIDVGGQGMVSKVIQTAAREVTFTLIEPDVSRRPGQIDDFLRWHRGAGAQHIAFRTSNIVAAVRTLAGNGVDFAITPDGYYQGLAERVGALDRPAEELRELGVLVDHDRWGRMYQIFTQSMHVRRTMFLELIERHGALTFGTSNIKALYEAKERELGWSGQDEASRPAAPRPSRL